MHESCRKLKLNQILHIEFQKVNSTSENETINVCCNLKIKKIRYYINIINKNYFVVSCDQ